MTRKGAVQRFRLLVPDECRKAMENAEWNDAPWEKSQEIRSIYLGSLINPSGKYYLPFACSNVEGCPRCHGTGKTSIPHRCNFCGGTGAREYPMNAERKGKGLFSCHVCDGKGKVNPECTWCAGMGSREAHLDELFWERMDKEAEALGYFIMSGEGAPCDSFLAECREKEEEE